MAGTSTGWLGVVSRGVVKVVALAVGLAGTLVGLDALVGALTENGWIRLVVVVLVAFGATLLLAERFIPEGDERAARGMPTDIVALVWLGFTVGIIGLAGGLTRPLLLREGDRLLKQGWTESANVTYWVAGARSEAPAPGRARPPARGTNARGGDAGTADAGAGSSRAEADAGGAAAPDGGAAPRTPPAPAGEKTPAELFREWAPSVVTVSVVGDRGEGGGTGFLLDALGTIGTNHHVIEGARKVEIKLFDGTIIKEVEMLDDAPSDDLALLRIKTSVRLKPVRLGDSERITVGDRVVSIGNPLGLEHTLTDGLISARRVLSGRKMIQMSAPVSPGNSGGPLFNMRGEVIGVTTAQYAGGDFFGRAQNLNLATPINLLRAMIRPAYPGRRRFGESHGTPNTW